MLYLAEPEGSKATVQSIIVNQTFVHTHKHLVFLCLLFIDDGVNIKYNLKSLTKKIFTEDPKFQDFILTFSTRWKRQVLLDSHAKVMRVYV